MILSRAVNEAYLSELNSALERASSKVELFEAIVNSPFANRQVSTSLGLGFLSFVLVNKKTRTINRISISNTDTAQGAIDITIKPFHELIIPLNYKGNCVAEAIRSGRYQQT